MPSYWKIETDRIWRNTKIPDGKAEEEGREVEPECSSESCEAGTGEAQRLTGSCHKVLVGDQRLTGVGGTTF